MLFTDLLKDDLIKAVRFYKVEVDPNANKQALANALLDAGVTPEQWAEESEAHDFGEPLENNAITKDDFVDPIVMGEPEPDTGGDPVVDEPEVEEDAMVLVRFIGRNRSYQTKGHKFSVNRPFSVLSREDFESLDPKKFRLATKAEANEFYN